VQGAALGGGTGLTAACDMAVASDDAAFSTSEVKFGIIPSVISPYVLRAIGPRHALRYFQSADQRPAAIGRSAPPMLDACIAGIVDALLAGRPSRRPRT
jgi:methylglutaconyl-CoA hydratase